MSECIFCQIVAGSSPADIVHESAKTIFIRDINPKAKVHVLGITRKHVVSALDVRPEDAPDVAEIWTELPEVAARLDLTKQGFRVLNNVGLHGEQEVDHLHFHILGGEPLGRMVCK